MCSLLGLSLPYQSILASCTSDKTVSSTDCQGTVLIIGAGAAGMTAGYLLNQQGVDFQILEASTVLGGRMKTTTDFVDFPISYCYSDHSLTSKSLQEQSVSGCL